MDDPKDVLTAEPEGAEAESIYEQGQPESDTAPETKETVETAELGEDEEELNLEELGLDPKTPLSEQLKEYKDWKSTKPLIERLKAALPKLKYSDLEDLIDAAEKFDPDAKPVQKTQPKAPAAPEGSAAEYSPEWLKGYSEDSQKFAKLLTKDLVSQMQGELQQKLEEALGMASEGIDGLANDQWYTQMLLDDIIAEKEKSLGLSRRQLRNKMNEFGTEWLSRQRQQGKNPYSVIRQIMAAENGNGAKTPAIKTGGIDRAKDMERPGGAAPQSGLREIKNPDGSVNWPAMIEKFGTAKVKEYIDRKYPAPK